MFFRSEFANWTIDIDYATDTFSLCWCSCNKFAEPKKETPKVKKPEWEVKDRTYLLRGNKTPLTLTIPGKHTRKHSLLWFDPKTQNLCIFLQALHDRAIIFFRSTLDQQLPLYSRKWMYSRFFQLWDNMKTCTCTNILKLLIEKKTKIKTFFNLNMSENTTTQNLQTTTILTTQITPPHNDVIPFHLENANPVLMIMVIMWK